MQAARSVIGVLTFGYVSFNGKQTGTSTAAESVPAESVPAKSIPSGFVPDKSTPTEQSKDVQQVAAPQQASLALQEMPKKVAPLKILASQIIVPKIMNFLFGDEARKPFFKDIQWTLKYLLVQRALRSVHADQRELPEQLRKEIESVASVMPILSLHQLGNAKFDAKRISNTNLVLKDLAFRFPNCLSFASSDPDFEFAFLQGLAHFPKLKRISCMPTHATDYKAITARFDNVVDLRLGAGIYSAKVLEKILGGFPNLHTFHCCTSEPLGDFFQYFIQNKGKFRSLELGSCGDIPENALTALIDAQPNLTTLILHDASKLSNQVMLHLTDNLPKLQTFGLHFTDPTKISSRLTHLGFMGMAKLAALRAVQLSLPSWQNGKEDAFLEKMAKIQSLQTLSIEKLYFSSESLQKLQGLPLQVLRIDLRGKAIPEQFFAKCHLKRLELLGYNLENSQCIAYCAKHLGNRLEHLTLSFWTNEDLEPLASIATLASVHFRVQSWNQDDLETCIQPLREQRKHLRITSEIVQGKL